MDWIFNRVDHDSDRWRKAAQLSIFDQEIIKKSILGSFLLKIEIKF